MILNTKRIHNSFWGNFPAKAKQMPSKSFICGQEKATTAAVRSLRAKIVSLQATVNVLKIIIFWLNYLTVLIYTKTIIHLIVGG